MNWVGPHEGIEYALMKSGMKPAALIDPSEFNKAWVDLLAEKNLVAATIRFHGPFPYSVVITKAGDHERQRRLIEEFGRSYRDHFRLGLLFGYCWEHVLKFCEKNGRFSGGKYG